ncbi:PP2C family protein-serine/threonine phosphatase [Streptomyces spiralis]|uniref:PP2C family protein-serine/threonine phosphatase n=1 Tax=Streptomyces spiralis TaxID=66376 RepID=UPI0036B0C17F
MGACLRPGRAARPDRVPAGPSPDDVRGPAHGHPGVRPHRARPWAGRAVHVRWSNAGHLPPLLVGADGSTRYLAPARHGIPVGIEASCPRFSHEEVLPPGSTLLLFTDGLVERRGQDIDTGLDDLAERAARLATAPPEELCDALISRGRQVFDDDVALLALRIPSDGPAR